MDYLCDEGYGLEEDLQEKYMAAKKAQCLERGDKPDDYYSDDKHRYMDYDFVVDGVTLEFVNTADDVSRGFGAKLFYHDWDYDARHFSDVAKTVHEEWAKVHDAVDKALLQMGLDPTKADVWLQTCYQ